MFLNSVRITHFRNIGDLELKLDGAHAAFIGPNGAGKTNLLEAVYFALKGHPFRSFVQKEDLFPKGAQTSPKSLSIKVALFEEGQRKTELHVNGEANKHRFSFIRNEKRVSLTDLSFRFPVIAFSPQDHELVRGSPEVRRRFLDQVFADVCPGYYEICSLFDQALKQRNRLLKLVAEKETSPFELRSWNQVFVDRAFQLFQLRKDIFPEFHHHFLNICEKMSDSFYQEIQIELQTTLSSPENLLKTLEEDMAKDLATKWTHSGPHRDDLNISIYGQKSRATASQGQGRLLGLLLRWTHAQWIQTVRQEKALFILDDFSSELDQIHRDHLIRTIFSDANQVLWSATELPQNNLLAEMFNRSKLFNIFAGQSNFENSINSSI
jgi:DNA replication and repair protein RecF